MDKNDLERRLEAAEKQNLGLLDEIKNLKAQLTETQDEEIPKFPVFVDGMPFWFCNDAFFVQSKTAHGSIDYPNFNLFHSEKYAQLFADKCREIAMLLHCKWYVNRYYVPDFNNSNQMKWVVYYDHNDKCYKQDYWFTDDPLTVCFENKETAQKAADWMNAHAKRGDSNDD